MSDISEKSLKHAVYKTYRSLSLSLRIGIEKQCRHLQLVKLKDYYNNTNINTDNCDVGGVQFFENISYRGERNVRFTNTN